MKGKAGIPSRTVVSSWTLGKYRLTARRALRQASALGPAGTVHAVAQQSVLRMPRNMATSSLYEARIAQIEESGRKGGKDVCRTFLHQLDHRDDPVAVLPRRLEALAEQPPKLA